MKGFKKIQADKEASKKQKAITKQWQLFATISGRDAYKDLMEYIDLQRELYRQYAEDMQMPSPTGKGMVHIDKDTAAILLQNSRGLRIIQTYIRNRVDTDVAPIKKN